MFSNTSQYSVSDYVINLSKILVDTSTGTHIVLGILEMQFKGIVTIELKYGQSLVFKYCQYFDLAASIDASQWAATW